MMHTLALRGVGAHKLSHGDRFVWEDVMAKARKKARKTVAKRPAKKTRLTTAKLKGRKVTKAKARPAKKQGMVASAVQAIGDAVRLRTRLGGHNKFEDQ
jgi:hypothetical protein